MTLVARILNFFRKFFSHPIMKIDVIDKRASDGDGQVKAVGHQMKEFRPRRLTCGNLLPDMIETKADTSWVHPTVSHGYQVMDTLALKEKNNQFTYVNLAQI